MARVSAAEKAKSHAAIVEEASRMFRQRGIAETSISDVMRAAGLTHGGFYRHFQSKKELVEAAFRLGVDAALERLDAARTKADCTAALNAYINAYLSLEHVRNDQQGCILAALSAEAARDEETVKNAASQAATRVISAIAKALSSRAPGSHKTAEMVFASLMGTISLARVATNQGAQKAILKNGHKAVAVLIAEGERPPQSQ